MNSERLFHSKMKSFKSHSHVATQTEFSDASHKDQSIYLFYYYYFFGFLRQDCPVDPAGLELYRLGQTGLELRDPPGSDS